MIYEVGRRPQKIGSVIAAFAKEAGLVYFYMALYE